MKRLTKLFKQITGITLAATMMITAVPVYAANEGANHIHTDGCGSEHASNVEVSNTEATVVNTTNCGTEWKSWSDDSQLEASDNNVSNVGDAGGLTVSYYDNGVFRTKTGCKEFTNNMSDGWYALDNSVSTNDAVVIQGTVNLILIDRNRLDANNGIYITKGSHLIIWAQSDTPYAGSIYAHPENGPGIGSVRDTMGGNLTINGGIIDCKGGPKAAGIGGGRGENSGFGNITINGGMIKVKGGDHSAGIGRGHRNWNFGVITINGGDIDVKGGSPGSGRMGGAGIGGSEDRGTPPVIINGGKIKAEGDSCAAGIGGGSEGHQVEKITINGGEVTAMGGASAAGIGSGAPEVSIRRKHFNGAEIEINGGIVNASNDGRGGSAIGAGEGGKNGPITINGGTVNATSAKPYNEASFPGTAIGSDKSQDQGDPITINGGVVNAVSNGKAAAIGGGKNGGVIRINGGTVIAFAKDGAAIGGGQGNGGNITITGGKVNASATGRGAGIGGGDSGNGGSITITGGEVRAGGGIQEENDMVQVKSGPAAQSLQTGASEMVYLWGALLSYFLSQREVGGAAIGGGYKGNGGNVKITGGIVFAATKMKGAATIGRGAKGDYDGSLELYDEASVEGVEGGNGIANYYEKDDRIRGCRAGNLLLIKKCEHIDATYKDENAKVHTDKCKYCKSQGKDLESNHKFDSNTHKCVCGRMQRKVDVHVEGINLNADEVSKNIDISATVTDGLSSKGVKDGSSYYVIEGDTITVTMRNKDELQEAKLTYVVNGEEKSVQPISSEKNKEGYMVYKYQVPKNDCSLNLKVSRSKEPGVGHASINYMPYAHKDRVYNGKPQTIVYPGGADHGTLYYAIGDNDKEAPAFDGLDSDKKESDRRWQQNVPSATNAGKYYVWYMVIGDDGYENVEPKCLECEIKPAFSLKTDESTKKGEIRDTTDDNSKGTRSTSSDKVQTKSSYDVHVDIVSNGINGSGKANIKAGDVNIKGVNNGETFSAKPGEKLIIDVPYDHDYLCKVEGFYAQNGQIKRVIEREYNVGAGGGVHTELIMPASEVKLTLTFTRNNHEKSTISYESPKANRGLIYNGKAQALIKIGHTSEGRFYYALGDNNITAPEFDGKSENINKTWSESVPKGTEAGTYYVWYKVVKDYHYYDVEPRCIEVEIGKNGKQIKEAKKYEEDTTPIMVPVETKTDDTKKSDEEVPMRPTTNPYNVKPSGTKKLPDVVEVEPEQKEEGVNIWIEEEDITDSLDDSDKMNLYNNFSQYEIPLVIDMRMYMKVGDNETEDISDLDEEVELDIDIPAKYVEKGREFVILRLNEDDTGSITSINPTNFDEKEGTLTFKTDKICPIAIAYKVEEEEEPTYRLKTPSLISPQAKDGLYYSDEEMELVIPGTATGGTIYYALGDDSMTAPDFDGLKNSDNKKWSTNIPKGKNVGSYYIWYKVVGDEEHTDLDPSCVVSEIKEVPSSKKHEDVPIEKGKVTDITKHPDVVNKDEDTIKNKAAGDSKNRGPVDAVVEEQDYKKIVDIEPEEEEEGVGIWIDINDITGELSEEDLDTIYERYDYFDVGALFDFTMTMIVGDEMYDVTDLEGEGEFSFEVPEDLVKQGREYIIFMVENDFDFTDMKVIKPTRYDENTHRLYFKSRTVMPFILGYTDSGDADAIVTVYSESETKASTFEKVDDESNDKSTVTTNESTNNDPTKQSTLVVEPQLQGQIIIDKPQEATPSKGVVPANASTPTGTTLNLTSAKTKDGNVFDIILDFIIGLFD